MDEEKNPLLDDGVSPELTEDDFTPDGDNEAIRKLEEMSQNHDELFDKDAPDEEDEELEGESDEEDEYESDEEEDDGEEEGDDEEEDDGSDEDLKSFGADVRKLVMAERAKVKEAMNRKVETPNIGELVQLREKSKKDELDKLSFLGELADIRFEEAKKKLIQAKEEGETAKEIEAQDEYLKLRDVRYGIQAEKEKLEAESKAPPPQEPVQPRTEKPTNEGSKWLTRNATILKDRPDILKFARAMDNSAHLDGDVNSPGYFDAMNRLISAKFPDAKLRGTRAKKKKMKPNKGNPPPSLPTGTNRPSKKKVRKFTANELRRYEAMGLDYSNPEHKAAMDKEILNKK